MSPEKRRSLNYTELGRAAMGQFGKWAVVISVLSCNLGVCAGYMIFISSNLQVKVCVMRGYVDGRVSWEEKGELGGCQRERGGRVSGYCWEFPCDKA